MRKSNDEKDSDTGRFSNTNYSYKNNCNQNMETNISTIRLENTELNQMILRKENVLIRNRLSEITAYKYLMNLLNDQKKDKNNTSDESICIFTNNKKMQKYIYWTEDYQSNLITGKDNKSLPKKNRIYSKTIEKFVKSIKNQNKIFNSFSSIIIFLSENKIDDLNEQNDVKIFLEKIEEIKTIYSLQILIFFSFTKENFQGQLKFFKSNNYKFYNLQINDSDVICEDKMFKISDFPKNLVWENIHCLIQKYSKSWSKILILKNHIGKVFRPSNRVGKLPAKFQKVIARNTHARIFKLPKRK